MEGLAGMAKGDAPEAGSSEWALGNSGRPTRGAGMEACVTP